MFGLLLKKQLTEFFRTYFYNPKTGKRRTAVGVIGCFILFFCLSFGVIGGACARAALSLCAALLPAGYGWLYYALFAVLSLLLGVIGSAFSAYSVLYLAKDNDLLLSMPIPPKTIAAARLSAVYLLGLFYNAVVLLPAILVRQILLGFSRAELLGGILLLLIISLTVFLLAALLGYGIAKISRKLKNKSFVHVLLSLVFIAGYYFVYYKAQTLLAELLSHIELYGEKIKTSAGVLFVLGSIGAGNFFYGALLLTVLIAAVLLVPVLLTRNFLRLTSGAAAVAKPRGRVEKYVQRAPRRALLKREFARFTASATYMLNGGIGLIFLLAAGIALLIFRPAVLDILDTLATREGSALLLCGGISAMLATCSITAPSISLEGNTLWIIKSMPLSPMRVLSAKLRLQLWLTLPVALFCAVCAIFVLQISPLCAVLSLGTVASAAVLFAEIGLIFGLKFPILRWTNEIQPIKQGISVLFTLLLCLGYAVLYLTLGVTVGLSGGVLGYFAAGFAVTFCLTLLCALWLKTRGAKLFAEL